MSEILLAFVIGAFVGGGFVALGFFVQSEISLQREKNRREK